MLALRHMIEACSEVFFTLEFPNQKTYEHKLPQENRPKKVWFSDTDSETAFNQGLRGVNLAIFEMPGGGIGYGYLM